MKLRLIKVINLILILTLLMPSYTFSSENPNMSDLYVIDSNINESHMFLNVVPKGSSVLVVHNGEDVFQEIYNQVKTNTIENIHIISNGKQSELSIGAQLIDLDYLKKNQEILRRIGSILKDGSDLLLYGCDVAYGKDGREYINTLADLTQLDVAASTNKTGVNNLGGDWKLEYQVGSINTDPVIVEGYEYLLDTKLTVVTNPIETAGAQTAYDNDRRAHAFDFDGDGDDDFIGTSDVYPAYVESNIYVNDGSGGFGTTVNTGFLAQGGYWYEHADIDGDGDLDLFAAETGSTATYYRNNGDNTFTSITNPLATAGATTMSGSQLTMKKIDYDSDGDIDFICYSGSNYEIFSNDGSGAFTKIVGDTFPALNATSYTIYDFDGDGQEDIFAHESDSIKYYKNSNGSFTLESSPFASTDISPSSDSNILLPYDFGADGDYDVISYDGSKFYMYENDGDNNFTKNTSYEFTVTETKNYIVADVDNDGDDDLMVGSGNNMTYYRHDGVAAGTNNRPPRLSSTTPSNGSTDIAVDSNIVLNFDETISTSNTKTIKIHKTSDDQLVESIPANDARVSGIGTSTITINPNATLEYSTSYYVLIEKSSLADEDGMIYTGLENKTDYAFTTTAQTYTVTYDANGAGSGSVPTDSSSYLNGATVTVATNSGTLARAGYSFDGWNTAANGSGTDRAVSSTFAMGSSNVTLYAKWTALPTYTLTYDANGADSGSVPTDSSSYLNGASVTVATNSGTLARAGYSFDGWNTAANGSGTDRAVSSTFAMGSSNVTLYAKWTALPTYTVTYDANGADSGTVPTDSSSYLNGASVTVATNSGTLARAGYSFDGWNTAANGSGTDRAVSSTFAMGSSNVTLYAKWTALPTYTLTYDANGADSGSVPTDSSSYLNGATITVATNSGTLARAGYSFDGWNTAANGSGTDRAVSSTFAMGSSNVTLYAKWTALPTYTVTYDANGADSGSVPTDSSSYLNGATVTVATNSGTLARAGYSFDGWNTAANGSGTDRAVSSTFAMGSSNVTLYAKWTALSTYTVTYDANGADSGSVPTDSSSYLNGATVTVATNSGTLARAGYSFDGWNTAANGSGTDRAVSSTFAMGSSNVTLYAKWTALPTYTVTYDANGADSGSVPTDSSSYLNGATVTVASNSGTLARAGYSFDGWNTAANGSGTDRAASSTFAMGSSNVTLYAKWTALPTYTVTYDANGADSGSVPTDSSSYLNGATVTVATNSGTLARAGYSFDGWNTAANGSGTDRAASSTFAMGSSNVTLYAKWTALSKLSVPTISPSSSTFTNSVTISMNHVTSGASIYFTTDGSTPSTGSTLYSQPVQITDTTTIKAVATMSGYIQSDVITSQYDKVVPQQLPRPTYSPNTLNFTNSVNVQLYSTVSGSAIYYTTDGTTPSSSSNLYSGVVNLTNTTTIKAINIKTGYIDSPILQVLFTRIVENSSNNDSDDSNEGSSNNESENEPTNGSGINGDSSEGAFTIGEIGSKTDKKITVETDEKAIKKQLEVVKKGSVISIPISESVEAFTSIFSVQSVKDMQDREIVLEIATKDTLYGIKTTGINIKEISDQVGESVALEKIEFDVNISKSTEQMVEIVQSSADENDLEIVIPPIDFKITARYQDKEVDVNRFNTYMTRKIRVPEGVDSSKITTAIVTEENGRVRHIPTYIEERGGEIFAVVNSLTNSTYTLVYHECTFNDIDGHWAQQSIKNLGDRLIVAETHGGQFVPNEVISRAEFIKVLIKALGLRPEDGNEFIDVDKANDANEYIVAAKRNKLIAGIGQKMFLPMNRITREDVMVIIYNASESVNPFDNEMEINLEVFNDYDEISEYAKPALSWGVRNGLLVGKAYKTLAPKDNITRAELVTIIENYLVKSELINR